MILKIILKKLKKNILIYFKIKNILNFHPYHNNYWLDLPIVAVTSFSIATVLREKRQN